MWHRDTTGANAVGKMMPIGVIDAGMPQTLQFVKNAVSEKCNKVRRNKTRHGHIRTGTGNYL